MQVSPILKPCILHSFPIARKIFMFSCSRSHRNFLCHVNPSAERLAISTLDQTAEMGTTDTQLYSTPQHRFWVLMGSASIGLILAKGAAAAGSTEDLIFGSVSALGGYILADLGTGIYHWGIDNYGSAKTPLFGPQIDAFQGHHKRPWTITQRQFANNLHALARPASLFLLPIWIWGPENIQFNAFLGIFIACVVFSQQFHAWAHSKRSQLPLWVVYLQDLGLLVPRKMHGQHHSPPYDCNYCIVSGMWNDLLDNAGVFRWLENYIYQSTGIKPRCWSETSHEWLAEEPYFQNDAESDTAL